MSRFLSGAVMRHEWRLLWLNPATPVFLGFAWMVTGFLAFYAVPLLHLAHALGPLAYMPWIFTVLLPLLTMGMAEDERSGRLERILTLPIHPDAVWLTRFILYWLVAGLFLLGSWPLVASAAWLGNLPDAAAWLAVAQGYAVVWVLAGIQLALAFWLAAESGHGIVAFLCGFLLNLVLVAAGWHELRTLLGYFPAGAIPAGLVGDSVALFNMVMMPTLMGLIYVVWRRKRRLRALG